MTVDSDTFGEHINLHYKEYMIRPDDTKLKIDEDGLGQLILKAPTMEQ